MPLGNTFKEQPVADAPELAPSCVIDEHLTLSDSSMRPFGKRWGLMPRIVTGLSGLPSANIAVPPGTV